MAGRAHEPRGGTCVCARALANCTRPSLPIAALGLTLTLGLATFPPATWTRSTPWLRRPRASPTPPPPPPSSSSSFQLRGAQEGKQPAAGADDAGAAAAAIRQFVSISDAEDAESDMAASATALAGRVAAASSPRPPSRDHAQTQRPPGKVEMKIPSVSQEANRRAADSPEPIMH